MVIYVLIYDIGNVYSVHKNTHIICTCTVLYLERLLILEIERDHLLNRFELVLFFDLTGGLHRKRRPRSNELLRLQFNSQENVPALEMALILQDDYVHQILFFSFSRKVPKILHDNLKCHFLYLTLLICL